jgi:hypothetical protein
MFWFNAVVTSAAIASAWINLVARLDDLAKL